METPIETGRTCWCCETPLTEHYERMDGVCRNCGIHDVPLIELTVAGRLLADTVREMERIVFEASRAEPEPTEPKMPVW